MTARDLLDHTRRSLLDGQLLPPRSRVLVAVSGGADSVALLHLMTRLRQTWRLTIYAAHLNHGLRPTAHEDAEFVRSFGARWRVPTVIESLPVATQCEQHGWSLEEGARRVRYQWLLEVARRYSADHVATAHTADDQAETVLMRLLRGSGLLGLGAIPSKRPLGEAWIIRPLLGVWRREILAYLAAHRLTHREDETNADVQFVRNRIRHLLLPLLEREYNPKIKETLVRLAEQSQSDYAYLRASAQRQGKRVMTSREEGEVALAIAPWLRQPDAVQRELIRQAIQQVRGDLATIEFRHWLEILDLIRHRPPGSRVELPNGIVWRREAEQVVCARAAAVTRQTPRLQRRARTPLRRA